ncbi:NDP-hexose-3-ketoreductase [Spirochaetia bacterium]|nr:NDP-hexose-3-ketoreductase [Spirochaetia bacterium]
MNSILFLGYSNLLKTRILPILKYLNFDNVSIAKFKDQPWDLDYKNNGFFISTYDNYEEALESFRGNIVYISMVNSSHYKYALLSLQMGFNVIVDKPATLKLSETRSLLETAGRQKLLIGESLVYLMHPQFSQIDNIFLRYNDSPKLITAHFSMPPFTRENFRYKKELGGGAILDTSPYAVSLGRYFFAGLPETVKCVVNETKTDGVEIEYSLLMRYKDGRCLIGHFGFNTEYINQITIFGTRTNISLNRVFTIPEDLENTINIFHENTITTEYSQKGNNFRLYLEYYLKALNSSAYEDFYNNMLNDAIVREMINKSKEQ